MSKYCQYTVFF